MFLIDVPEKLEKQFKKHNPAIELILCFGAEALKKYNDDLAKFGDCYVKISHKFDEPAFSIVRPNEAVENVFESFDNRKKRKGKAK